MIPSHTKSYLLQSALRPGAYGSCRPKLLFLLSLLVVLPSGCFSSGAFEYEAVVAEYGGAPPRIVAPAGPPADVPEELTLPAAIRLALAGNPRQARAAARIVQARAAVAEAKAAFWPRFSAYTEYLQGDAPSAYLFKTIDARKLPPRVDFNEPGRFENWESGLQAQWNLYSGGRDLLRTKMAAQELRISHLGRQQLDNELTATVIDTYYSALAAQQFIAIARQAVETVEKQRELMRVRYEAGGVLKSDLLSLEVRQAEAREDLVAANNSYEQVTAALATLMGLEADTPVRPAAAESLELELPGAYDPALLRALALRPERAIARLQVVKSRMGVALARSGYLPRLDLQAKYYFDDPDFFEYARERENWTLGLVLNWEFFSGFSTPARIEKAEAAIRRMLALDREEALQIQLEVKKALLELEAAEARVRVTRESVAQAEESLRLVRLEYEGGTATVTRYLNAELARDQARFRSAQATYDRYRARADLARAIGYWAAVPPAAATEG